MTPRACADILQWAGELASRGWRGLLWLAADEEEAERRAAALWQAGGWRSPCWIAAQPPATMPSVQWLPPGKARSRLGGEHDLLVFDAQAASPFDADAFGALSGTLRAGGLLVLLTPPGWALEGAAQQAAKLTPYHRRLARRLAEAEAVAHWHGDAPLRLPALSAGVAPPASTPPGDCATPDQAEAVRGLVGLKRRRPLVITADRGRGKTAALGIACARLLEAGEREILVTAPRLESLAALFERLAVLRPEGAWQPPCFVDAGGGRVVFVAPDALTARVECGEAGGAGTRLLVDEAAAIPAALLGQWLAAFPRIAFATTVHGYEGSGRGFALRFRDRLARQAPDWRELHLDTSVRWAPGDPLERLVARLLLLDAEPPPAADAAEPLACRQWRGAELVREEATLQALFGLLVQAHYRTTPGDLCRLLDAPDLSLTTLSAAGQVQGVMACSDEGGFDSRLADQVARGERRLPGHLLAQSLAAHAGCRDALTARLRRIQRIAVHPARRREGLGARLLQEAGEAARHEGIDLLGASFGAEPGLIAFWQAQGFRAVRLGLSRETSTGEHALMVVRPTSAGGKALAERLAERFHRLLPALLAFELRGLEPRVAAALLGEGPAPELSDVDREAIADVAWGRREPALARPALQTLLQHAARRGECDPVLPWLVAWAFQGRDTDWLGARLGAKGRRDVHDRLRAGIAHLAEPQGIVRAFPARGG
ncbi:tRNA(Met) cytidine acetyltransferase TmcA [Halomonas sp. E14]|uniref:tRNA(Met) cytidine acetyltransferase TmcA n=1 Tax=Halomonas sp. E14 TaxID=3397245 RepID=UPI00403E80DE